MHNSIAIANYFIRLSQNKGLTLMQLLKLSYLAHGFKMGIFGEKHPLANELVQAWKFGPVFPNIYHEFKYEPPGEIKEMATFLENENFLKIVESSFNSEEKKIMGFVYSVYGGFTGLELCKLTHQKGTPWHNAWYNGGGKEFLGVTISNEEIASHFRDGIIKKYTTS